MRFARPQNCCAQGSTSDNKRAVQLSPTTWQLQKFHIATEISTWLMIQADLSRGGGPAHSVSEALLNLSDPFIPAVEHALIPLGVQQLSPGVQPDCLT